MERPTPILTVDAVVLGLFDGELKAAILQRDTAPHKGRLALPGGYVHVDEDLDTDKTMLRVLQSKLGITPRYLEQVMTVSGPSRDPRGWSASVVYLVLVEASVLLQLEAIGKVSLSSVRPGHTIPDLAFDHTELIQLALSRLREKAKYSTIIGNLLPKKFSLLQYHQAYEAITQRSVNISAFRLKLVSSGALREHSSEITTGKGRPAAAYSLKQPIAYFERDFGGKD